MLLSSKGIKEYLARKFRTVSAVKELSAKEVTRLINKLPVPTRFVSKKEPWLHQLQAYYAAICLRSILLVMDPGLGKTRICYDAFAFRKAEKKTNKMLVCTINEVNVYNWLDDAKTHRKDIKVIGLLGSLEERWRLRKKEADCYVVTYSGLFSMLEARKSRKMLPSRTRAAELLDGVNMIAFDEIHQAKDWKSLTHQCCDLLSSMVQYRIGATGTLFGRDVSVVYTQMKLIDRGETFGTTLGMFRAALFNEKKAWGGWRVYEFRKEMMPTLTKMLDNRSLTVLDSEVKGMPTRRRRVIPLQATPIQLEYIHKVKEALREKWIKKTMEGDKAAMQGAFVHLRMIASGFLGFEDENEVRLDIEFEDNPKLKALETFCNELPGNRKGVIVHEFVHSGKIICDALKKMRASYGVIAGVHSEAERKRRKRDLYAFKEQFKGPQFLVLNWRSGGTGLNFPVANYMHFYESPVSPINRKQTEGRVRRRNSLYARSFYTDAIIENSVEEKILGFIKEGKDLSRALLRDPHLVLGEET